MDEFQIKNLAIGKPKEYLWNKTKEFSAIGKISITEVDLKKAGFIGDQVANLDFHGGVDRAVCLYPFEHYAKWEKEFQLELPLPAFGENITATGMLENDVNIGDIYQIGETVIQVTQGRIPCSTISSFNGVDKFLNRVFTTGFTGYFFRVLEEGILTKNSEIKLVEPHPKKVSVLFANQILLHDHKNQQGIEKILEVEELAEVWRGKLKKLLEANHFENYKINY
jgi:MOSC domain-containing protein YiiM